MQRISDGKFAVLTIAAAVLLWALLQGTVSTVRAQEVILEPVSYRATIGVGVVSTLPDATVVTVPAE